MNNALDPAISVIVPHLNQAHQLESCLSSLARQSFELGKVEIIVVDNGSNAEPVDICRQFTSVTLTREDIPGPGPARNKGISISKAPILAFIDADCTADGKWLQAIADAFKDPGTDVIGGDVRIALVDPEHMTMLEAYESVYAYRQQEYIERQGFSGTGNLAMRRAVFEEVGPFAGIGVAEDREWGQRATATGVSIAYRPQMKVFHPARKTFAELQAKWDRHVAHDFQSQVHGAIGAARWSAKAIALAASPIWEVGRILTSDRLDSPTQRVLALRLIFKIRFYRSLRMISHLRQSGRGMSRVSWNR